MFMSKNLKCTINPQYGNSLLGINFNCILNVNTKHVSALVVLFNPGSRLATWNYGIFVFINIYNGIIVEENSNLYFKFL